MVYCKNKKCNSTNVEKKDLNFASIKNEGEPADKTFEEKYEFFCKQCGNHWFEDGEAYKIYEEYKKLKEETKIVAQDVKRGGTYKIDKIHVINPDKMMRVIELANNIWNDYRHLLDISPAEWHELQSDIK